MIQILLFGWYSAHRICARTDFLCLVPDRHGSFGPRPSIEVIVSWFFLFHSSNETHATKKNETSQQHGLEDDYEPKPKVDNKCRESWICLWQFLGLHVQNWKSSFPESVECYYGECQTWHPIQYTKQVYAANNLEALQQKLDSALNKTDDAQFGHEFLPLDSDLVFEVKLTKCNVDKYHV